MYTVYVSVVISNPLMFFWAAEEIELEGKTIELHASSTWPERNPLEQEELRFQKKTIKSLGRHPKKPWWAMMDEDEDGWWWWWIIWVVDD